MKNILLILFILSINLFAQEKDLKDIYTDFTTAINSVLLTKQGAMEVSGFLSYNYIKTEFEDNRQTIQNMTQLEPQLSYFFVDNVSAGLILSYSYVKTEYDNWIISGPYSLPGSTEQTLAGPIVKMYFGKDELRPFIFTDYLLRFGDSDGSEVDVGAGLFYHVSGNFGLNLIAKYGIIWNDEDIIKNQQRIFIGIGITNFIL